jgi:hypothetical protein
LFQSKTRSLVERSLTMLILTIYIGTFGNQKCLESRETERERETERHKHISEQWQSTNIDRCSVVVQVMVVQIDATCVQCTYQNFEKHYWIAAWISNKVMQRRCTGMCLFGNVRLGNRQKQRTNFKQSAWVGARTSTMQRRETIVVGCLNDSTLGYKKIDCTERERERTCQ